MANLPDPEFVGLVRFGADPNCPCSPPLQWRLITSQKLWHGHDLYGTDLPAPVHFLTKVVDRTALGGPTGTYTINPQTGIIPGRITNWAGGDSINATTERYGTGVPGDPSGSARLENPFRISAVQSWASGAFDSIHPVEVGLGQVVNLSAAEVGVALSYVTGFQLQPNRFPGSPGFNWPAGVPHFTPLDGRPIREPGRVPPGVVLGTSGIYRIHTSASRSTVTLMRLYLEGLLGYWSITDALYRGDEFGPDLRPIGHIETLAKFYYFHYGGPLNVFSPVIPDRLEPGFTDVYYCLRTILPGDAPPDGTDAIATGDTRNPTVIPGQSLCP